MTTRTLLLACLLLIAACADAPESDGAALALDVGCVSCHMETDTDVAPTLNGIFGTNVDLEDGSTVTVDESYVRRSIVEPQAQIVAGYEGSRMPVFILTDEEIDLLVDYVRGLG